jgi:hypothetical protein
MMIVASGWGRCLAGGALIALLALPGGDRDARASRASGGETAGDLCRELAQSEMVHVFDTEDDDVSDRTEAERRPHYVNDHTLVQAADGSWHLFGIFHAEPIGPDDEFDFIHAVAEEPDPRRWRAKEFHAAAEPYRFALRADRKLGETHLWAPHVLRSEGRYWMVYQSGGPDDYHAAIRLAESDDLYRWTRVASVPLFRDFCEARDPMLERHDGGWLLYYTRCEAVTRKVSGVAYRVSADLAGWSEPRMVLTLEKLPPTSNSAYTESPFVFQKDDFHYLSVSAYPVAFDATFLYRSRTPFAFPDVPFARVRAHAAEWITGPRGTFVTHAGPGQRGVWLSRIEGL